MVIHRIVEQKEPLRKVAAADGVSHETIRHLIRAEEVEWIGFPLGVLHAQKELPTVV